jgi:epoxyqueuosine reductase
VTVAVTAADLARHIARHAPAHGIDLVGAVPLTGPAPHAPQWLAWLDAGLHGGLDYLERTRHERTDPRLRNPDATTLLVFAQRYHDGFPADSQEGWLAGVARYARGKDYHDVFLAAVKALLAALRTAWPDLLAYPATDTGPYLERDWAEVAGLGFVGRNTCLIHESLGSALLLAVAPTNLEVSGWEAAPLYAVASRGPRPAPGSDRCGSCTRCLDACPTRAITAPRQLDAGRCLSTWTIEWRGRAPANQRTQQGDHLFGCDVCQEVCPWNGRAVRQASRRPVPVASYQPLADHADLGLADLLVMDAATFARRFRRTPLWRQHPEGLRRNALVVAANTGRRDLLDTVRRLADEDEDAEVRAVAAWAATELEDRS